MFGRKKRQPADLSEALAAQARAHDAIDNVAAREPEVTALVRNLERRTLKNNFGDSLVLAMERRQT